VNKKRANGEQTAILPEIAERAILDSVLECQQQVLACPTWGVTASTGLLAAERHAGVWTPVIAHKIISAEPQFALAA